MSIVLGHKLIVSVKKIRPLARKIIKFHYQEFFQLWMEKRGEYRIAVFTPQFSNSPVSLLCASFIKSLWIKCSGRFFPRIISTDLKVEKSYMEISLKPNNYTEHSQNLAKLMYDVSHIQCWQTPSSSTHVGGDLILYAHIFSKNNQWFGLSKFRAVTQVHFPVDYFQEKISDHRIWFCIGLIASIIIRNKLIFLIHFLLQTKSYCIWRTRCHILSS